MENKQEGCTHNVWREDKSRDYFFTHSGMVIIHDGDRPRVRSGNDIDICRNAVYSISFDTPEDADQGHGSSYAVTCPVCHYDYTHITTTRDGSSYHLWKQGGTGIQFNCEQGHHWTIWFGEHEGNVFTSWERLKDDDDAVLE